MMITIGENRIKKLLDFSIIIPTRNRVQMLLQTITSICAGNSIPKQIIAVDQSDRPIERKELEGIIPDSTRLDIVYLEKPSLTAARNAGIRKAECGVVVFMDDDVLLDEKTLDILYGDFEDRMTALVTAPNAGKASEFKRYPDILGTIFLRKKPFRRDGYVCKGSVLGRYPDRLKSAVLTEWAMGYFFAVRRDLLERFGVKFDEKLASYAYAEDLDFSYTFIKRANKEGFKAILDPCIYVNHLETKEGRIPTQKNTYMYVVHRYYLSYKHFKGGHMRLMLVWADIGIFLKCLFSKQRPADILRAHAACLRRLRLLRQGVIDKNLQDMIK